MYNLLFGLAMRKLHRLETLWYTSDASIANEGKVLNNSYVTHTYHCNILLSIGPPLPGDVQLKNGVNATEGRVEIYFNNAWATLCDKVATVNDGKVLCRALNLTFSRFLTNAYFGRGNSSASIVSTNCKGNELSLRSCKISALDTAATNCTHANDISVLCSSKCTNNILFLKYSNSFIFASCIDKYL